MNGKMKDKLKTAIITCSEKATETDTSIEALQYTQAALNAANALVSIELNVT